MCTPFASCYDTLHGATCSDVFNATHIQKVSVWKAARAAILGSCANGFGLLMAHCQKMSLQEVISQWNPWAKRGGGRREGLQTRGGGGGGGGRKGRGHACITAMQLDHHSARR